MKTLRNHQILAKLVVVVFLVSSLLGLPNPVRAASQIVVNTTVDEIVSNTKCSLREAIISANENRAVGGCASGSTGTDVITIPADPGPGVYYNVNIWGTSTKDEDEALKGDLDILDSVIIQGAGSTLTTIASGRKNRVFHLVKTGSKLVTIQNLKIVFGENVSSGGAILNQASTLILRNVNITGNHATERGGALSNEIQLSPALGATIKIYQSLISANGATQDGGGIYNEGNLEIYNSLISSNTAGQGGGGVDNNSQQGFKAKLTNTTVTKNIAGSEEAGAGISTSGLLDLINCSIHDNTGGAATVKGLVVKVSAIVTFKNTIISGQTANQENCAILNPKGVVSNGHNLEDKNSCHLNTVAGDQINAQPGFGALTTFGATQLYVLPSGSPAIDAGSNADCPLTDQRGVNYARPADGGTGTATCDIGAYEAAAVPAKSFYLPITIR
jgi:CSLREA domain-containing protein